MWDFSAVSTIDLARSLELYVELQVLGMGFVPDGMIPEMRSELLKRGDDEEDLITILVFHNDPEIAGIRKLEQKMKKILQTSQV